MAANLTTFPLSTKKLSELATDASIDGTEKVHLLDGSTNKVATLDAVQAYFETFAHGFAQYYMINNATSTPIAVSGTYYKVLGTTSAGLAASNFTLSDNKALFTGAITSNFKITALMSLTSGNNKDIAIEIAKNGTTQARSKQEITTDGGGKMANIYVKDAFSLATNDYLEIFITNNTDTTAITTVDLNVIIEKLH